LFAPIFSWPPIAVVSVVVGIFYLGNQLQKKNDPSARAREVLLNDAANVRTILPSFIMRDCCAKFILLRSILLRHEVINFFDFAWYNFWSSQKS
jgi:hypothetical protein